MSYKRFRGWITCRGRTGVPAASTPLATERRRWPSLDLDTVCLRLELDSPPPQRGLPEGGVSHSEEVTSPTVPSTQFDPEQLQGWTWRAAVQRHVGSQQTDSDKRKQSVQPFAALDEAAVTLQGQSVMRLVAPSLLNDYYTNVLDCSCNGLVALALGPSVYIWSSDTQSLVGHLDPGGRHCQSVSSLCWSVDGRALCIGTRRGEIQFWDVEHMQNTRCLPSHMSAVGAVSWNQQVLSSGSVLGHIHHLDPRASARLVGAANQRDGVCSLQWSPGDEWLASGSTGGLLRIWDSDTAGHTRSQQPVITVNQPSAAKAVGWCPWQRNVIATGGGWKDGELRIWDTQSGTCVSSVDTNSQICSLRWAEQKQCLVTGHGGPHHPITCWTWERPSINQVSQLTGHCGRVLHLAVSPDNTRLFSAGADQCFHIWDL